MQVMHLLELIWIKEGLHLPVITFQCLPTASGKGGDCFLHSDHMQAGSIFSANGVVVVGWWGANGRFVVQSN